MAESDDWMHPRSIAFTMPEPKNGTFHQIQRKRATPVTGNVSHIYSWDVWREFENRAERDAELKRLRKEHPSWHLRARTLTYFRGEVIGGFDPFEYADA